MLGTIQPEGLGGNDGEHMMTVVRGSSMDPSIVPVDSTISDSESLPSQFVMPFLHQRQSSYLHNGGSRMKLSGSQVLVHN